MAELDFSSLQSLSALLHTLGMDDPGCTLDLEIAITPVVLNFDRRRLTVLEATVMLRAAPRSWSHLHLSGCDLESNLVLHAVAGCPDPELVPVLKEVAPLLNTLDGRVRIVSSTLEIAARADSKDAAEFGLSLALRYLQDRQFELTDRHAPLGWLCRQPVQPAVVLALLEPLLQFGVIIPEVLRVRAAYRAAGFGMGSPISLRHIAQIGESGDETFVSFATGVARAVSGSGLPRDLVNVADVWELHNEVLNGGLTQYFWNTRGRRAGSAARGYTRLGLGPFASLLKTARQRFDASIAEFQAVTRTRDLDCWSEWCSNTLFDDLDQTYVDLDEQSPMLGPVSVYLGQHQQAIVDFLNR